MKRFTICLFSALLLISLVMPAFAADGNVTYSGNSGQLIFAPGSQYSPTDLFPNFKDVMPGDSISQTITVKNKASKKVKVKLYMRALGAQEGSEEFLGRLRLRVEKSANNTMDYMFDAAASETAQLTEWTYLGTIYSGGTVNLNVILDVPTSLDNTHRDQIGYLDWEFKIEERPVEPGDPKPPKTGDEFMAWLWAGLMILSMTGILFLVIMKKRKEYQ